MRRIHLLFLMVSLLVLSACSNEGKFNREISKVDKLNEKIVEQIESLNEETSRVESSFKQTAKDKKEFQAKNTDVDKLIENEEKELDILTDSTEKYDSHFNNIKEINYEKLDDEDKKHYKTIEASFNKYLTSLKNYKDKNNAFINKQKKMREAFKEEDNNFKMVYAYINELNQLVDDVNNAYSEFKNNHLIFSDNIKKISDSNGDKEVTELADYKLNKINLVNDLPDRLKFKAPFTFTYPKDGVKGIYVSGYVAGGDMLDNLISYMKEVGLNSVVIDVKGDYGDIMYDMNNKNKLYEENTYNYYDVNDILKKLEDNEIYPIARIVTFKDTLLAEAKPDWSFKNSDGSLWSNGNGESFINPFMKEVWDYNLGVAINAAEAGFKDIQFDYVRFPEGFETYYDTLTYNKGEYEENKGIESRVQAITDFVKYAKENLKPYNVDVSIDIFGYSATEGEAPGIGQNFKLLSEQADVMSSMIYPSHWGPGYFGLDAPDTEPYEVVSRYIDSELDVYNELKNPPKSRPWLQDFTASYLGAGNYINYNGKEVMDQVRALEEKGVNEFLLWDASNEYSRDVNFK